MLVLTESERARLRRLIRRPRTRKQLYRAEAILAVAEGTAPETVARQHRVGVERVEEWISRFERDRFEFLEEPKPRQAAEPADEDE